PRVRVEGVAYRGHRVVIIGATVDPGVMNRIDEYLPEVEAEAERKLDGSGIDRSMYKLYARVYGRNGVLGPLEFRPPVPGEHEITVVYEIVARSAPLAT